MSPRKKTDDVSEYSGLLVALFPLFRRYWRFFLILAVIAGIGYVAYTSLGFNVANAPISLATPPADAGTSSVQAQVGLPDWLQVYFTDPNPPDVLGKGIDQVVKKDIDTAARTIDVTSFDLNNPDLVDALAAAARRGIKVRVVYDGANGSLDLENAATNNKPYDALTVFKTANVPAVDGGRSNGLMHDKMVIIDSKILYMGSWNFSYNDTYRNNNNLLRITDPQIIANYQGKFNELFVDKLFGTHARYKAPNPALNSGGVPVENFFSPEDKVMDKLIAYVQGAQKQVHYMIFTYTDDNLANAMIARSKAGAKVEGVIENRGASQGAMVPIFCAKLPVKLDGNKYTMHHKVIIIDNATVITGSFNFTKSADDANDDNLLVIHSPAVAALYEQEFQKIYSAGMPPSSADVKCTN